MTPDLLLSLAARCEASDGADRELDVLISRAAVVDWPARRKAGAGLWRKDLQARADCDWEYRSALRFTRSMDAAISLVPEGYGWQYSSVTGTAYVFLALGGPVAGDHEGNAARALSAAALRARAAMVSS